MNALQQGWNLPPQGRESSRWFTPLQRSLSFLETWSFGVTSHISWISTAPAIHAALGAAAFWVWVPIVIVGMLLNLQVQSLSQLWPNVAGGTPNYITRLLKNQPALADSARQCWDCLPQNTFTSWVYFINVYCGVQWDAHFVNFAFNFCGFGDRSIITI
jgi:hypothetical protein